MKRLWNCLAALLVVFALLPVRARAAELLIPVGKVVGLQLRDGSVTVAAFDDVLGADAKAAGLKIGDEIIQIDETAIGCPEDVRRALETCDGDAELTLRRGSRRCTVTVPTRESADGPRLGVYLRQGIAGIGTVTFYDPDTGKFGALGHGVSETGGGLLNMKSGNAYDAAVLSVKRGKCGEPGQLKGTADPANAIGTLLRNTPQGVFGVTKQGRKGHPLHGGKRYAPGLFCGNSENLSKGQSRRPQSAAEGHGSEAAGNHRGNCTGYVRQPHHPGRQTYWRGYPCSC